MRAITSTGRNVEHLHLMNQAQRGKGVTLQNPRTRICRKQNQQLGKGWHLQTVEDGFDNALAETINGLYKAEVIHRRGPWRSLEAVEFATLEWVNWFNHRRLLEPIGNIPPAEAEERYYAVLERPAMAA